MLQVPLASSLICICVPYLARDWGQLQGKTVLALEQHLQLITSSMGYEDYIIHMMYNYDISTF